MIPIFQFDELNDGDSNLIC